VPEPTFFAEDQETEEWQELKLHNKGHKPLLTDIKNDPKKDDQHKQEQLCFSFLDKDSDYEAC
jgi:hypothetical protein